MLRVVLLGLAVVGVASVVAACGDDQGDTDAGPKVFDPGPVHVHGLGINPKDGALFLATHTGLFRVPPGETEAKRVAGRFQDTMGFTVVGPDRFLGSGHPDGREKLPPFLGLIRSDDAGKTWEPVSLLGKRDFHVLEAAGNRVYGFGSDYESRQAGFLVSEDGGDSWHERETPEPLLSLAIDPASGPDRLVGSGERGLHLSEDAGRRWFPLDGPSGLVAWNDRRLVVIDWDGSVYGAPGPEQRLRPVGEIGGRPAALDTGPAYELYVALHDGTVKVSTDGGASWEVRSQP